MYEPLKELSLFAYHWAPHFCDPSCRLYHQNWSMTRFLQTGFELPTHANFFIEKIRHRCEEYGEQKILISGSADTGLLATVYEAIAKTHLDVKKLDITLIDRCATVIEQNRLLAKKLGINLQLLCGDLLSTPLEHYDIILAHHFINFFSNEQKPKLFQIWSKALANRGTLLIYNKTSEEFSGSVKMTIDPQKIEARLREFQTKIAQNNLPSEILKSIEEFMYRENIREQFSRSELMHLIQSNQLKILDHRESDDSTLKVPKGPTAGRLGDFVRTTHLLALSKA